MLISMNKGQCVSKDSEVILLKESNESGYEQYPSNSCLIRNPIQN